MVMGIPRSRTEMDGCRGKSPSSGMMTGYPHDLGNHHDVDEHDVSLFQWTLWDWPDLLGCIDDWKWDGNDGKKKHAQNHRCAHAL